VPDVTVSIVSHGHEQLVRNLLSQLSKYNTHIAKVVITHNIPNDFVFNDKGFPFELVSIENIQPLGFGENHNRAFKYCETAYYCIMNPDVILTNDPFGNLLKCAAGEKSAIIAPLITNLSGVVEDSARYFPTPFDLFKKIFHLYDGVFPVNESDDVVYPEWVGGMFMLVKVDKYQALSGFDESYFLYYEDVDFCLRAWRSCGGVALCKSAVIIHDARRQSRKSFQFFKWHISSAARFFIKHLWRFPKAGV
jgi:GT2 family glycosyltransferase